ncbi:MAG: HEPN domain-containing protein [Anaerolineae bacterium]|nr:HEPN domain-containing protein [Anaerolineae bacterium]
MNPLTIEWVEKAEGDFITAQREYRARNRPNYDAACFHAQQTAEKYLKAWLQESGKPIPRIHNFVELVSLCIENDRTFAILEVELMGLDGYAVRTRYPVQNATKEEALFAIKTSKNVSLFIQKKLGLS